jgi:hypothetical protein
MFSVFFSACARLRCLPSGSPLQCSYFSSVCITRWLLPLHMRIWANSNVPSGGEFVFLQRQKKTFLLSTNLSRSKFTPNTTVFLLGNESTWKRLRRNYVQTYTTNRWRGRFTRNYSGVGRVQAKPRWWLADGNRGLDCHWSTGTFKNSNYFRMNSIQWSQYMYCFAIYAMFIILCLFIYQCIYQLIHFRWLLIRAKIVVYEFLQLI